MCAEQDTRSRFGVVTGHNVTATQHRSVVSAQFGALIFHLTTKAFKLLGNPFAAIVVAFGVHGTRSEGALRGNKGISRVGIKGRPHRVKLFCGGHLGFFRFFYRTMRGREQTH